VSGGRREDQAVATSNGLDRMQAWSISKDHQEHLSHVSPSAAVANKVGFVCAQVWMVAGVRAGVGWNDARNGQSDGGGRLSPRRCWSEVFDGMGTPNFWVAGGEGLN
jgi:hypothetical protein